MKYSRFFGKLTQARSTEVFPALQRWFFDQIDVGALTVDLDSTVITREGHQEGSAKGYNPNRRGRNSHHPLLPSLPRLLMLMHDLGSSVVVRPLSPGRHRSPLAVLHKKWVSS